MATVKFSIWVTDSNSEAKRNQAALKVSGVGQKNWSVDWVIDGTHYVTAPLTARIKLPSHLRTPGTHLLTALVYDDLGNAVGSAKKNFRVSERKRSVTKPSAPSAADAPAEVDDSIFSDLSFPTLPDPEPPAPPAAVPPSPATPVNDEAANNAAAIRQAMQGGASFNDAARQVAGGPPSPPPPPGPPAGGGGGRPPGGPQGREPRPRTVRPIRATAGQSIQIAGNYLEHVTAVTVGGTVATIQSRDRYLIVAVVPAGVAAGAQPVQVQWSGGYVDVPTTFTVDDVPAPAQPGGTPPTAGGGGGGGNPPPSWLDNFLEEHPNVANFARPMLRYAGPLAGTLALANIRGSYGTARNAAQEVFAGAESVLDHGFQVGARIGQTILDGVLSPFGASGRAVSSFAGQAVQGAGSLLKTGLHLAGGVVATGVGLAGGALSLGLGAGGALIGGMAGASIGSAPGALVGFAVGTGIGLAVLKGIESVTHLVGGVVGQLGDAFGKLGEVANGALKTVLDVLKDVTDTAATTGKAVLKLESIGYSGAQAGNLVQTLGMLGMNPQQVTGIFGHPFAPVFNPMSAGVLGLPDPTTNIQGFIAAGARRQAEASRNPMSAGIWQSMLSGAGFGEFSDVFALGPRRVNRMLEMSKPFQVGGAALGELGGDLTMANTLLGGFATQIKLLLAETLIPLMPQLADGFAWIVGHKDEVVGAIQSFGQWAFVRLPSLAGEGLGLIGKTVTWFLNGTVGFITAFQNNEGVFVGVLGSILKGIDYFSTGMKGLAVLFGFVQTVLENFAITLYNAFVAVMKLVPTDLLRLVPDGGSVAADAIDSMKFARWTMFDKDNPFNSALDMPTSDLYGQFQNFQNSSELESSRKAAVKMRDAWDNGPAKQLEEYRRGLVEGEKGREETLQNIHREVKRSADANEVVAGAVNAAGKGGSAVSFDQFMAYLLVAMNDAHGRALANMGG